MKSLIVAAALAALGASLGTSAVDARSMSSMAMPTCAAGDKVVWVNTRSKVFYEPGASYYGKTKHGKFVCESSATSMGMHMARGSMMSDSNGMSMHHGMMKHHHHGMMHDGGSMTNDSSMKSGSSMKPDSAGSGKNSGFGATTGSGVLVSPAPIVTASPSN